MIRYLKTLSIGIALVAAALAQPAYAATTCASIPADLAAAAPGSTVVTGPITCAGIVRLNNLSLHGVTLDASGATFLDGAAIVAVAGLRLNAGTWGTAAKDTIGRYAIDATDVTDFSVSNATVVAGPSGDRGGVKILRGRQVTVRDSAFAGHSTGLSVQLTRGALVTRNRFTSAVSDGIQLVANQGAIISANYCRWEVRVGTAHPDCIQLWSLPTLPLQADIWVLNNAAIGNMQGVLSSDPKTGSGERLHFHGNYTPVIFSHTITCGMCRDSVATDNVLASYPGSLFGIGSLKGFEPTRGNVAARNPKRDGTKALPPRIWSFIVPPIWQSVGSQYDDRSFNPVSVETAQ